MNIEEQIRRQLNIVEVVSEYLTLTKKGNNYWGLCPFHQDSSPSMSVNSSKSYFKCFTCGTGGNVIDFVSNYEKISHGKAVEKLAKRIGVEIPKDEATVAKYNESQLKLISVFKDASDFFQLMINSVEGEKALAYAEKRGLTPQIRESFLIGYSSNGLIDFLKAKGHDESNIINASLMNSAGKAFYTDRLMYGITNSFGDVVAFSGRLIEGEGAKYINSAESLVFHKSSVLYNFSNAKDFINKDKEVYILEGFMDVIAMHKAGIKNSVAIMGTALTKDHLNMLKGVSINLMLDGDSAGINASLKSIKLLLANHFTVKVISNSDGKDADEILSTLGKEKLIEVVNNKINALDFVYKALKQKYNMNEINDIKLFISEFTSYLSDLNELEKDFYVNKISMDTKISKEAVASVIPGSTYYQAAPKQVASQTQTINVAQNLTYKLIKSMLEKSFLAMQLKNNKAHFDDPLLLGIAQDIVTMAEFKTTGKGSKPVPSLEAKMKVNEIMSSDIQSVNTPEEFNDLINLINKQGIDTLIQSLSVKLNNATTDEEKANYLQQIKEAQNRKRKYGKSNR